MAQALTRQVRRASEPLAVSGMALATGPSFPGSAWERNAPRLRLVSDDRSSIGHAVKETISITHLYADDHPSGTSEAQRKFPCAMGTSSIWETP